MKKLVFYFISLLSVVLMPALHAQDQEAGLPINLGQFPAPVGVERQYFYDGNNVLQYICYARQIQPVTSVSINATTLTNIVVAANVGTVTTAANHNLYSGALVQVVDPQTPSLAGIYTIRSVPSSTTYTITTSGVSNGTYTDAGLVINTSNPLLNAPVWGIQAFINAGPGNTISEAHAALGAVGLPRDSNFPMNLACSNRSIY